MLKRFSETFSLLKMIFLLMKPTKINKSIKNNRLTCNNLKHQLKKNKLNCGMLLEIG